MSARWRGLASGHIEASLIPQLAPVWGLDTPGLDAQVPGRTTLAFLTERNPSIPHDRLLSTLWDASSTAYNVGSDIAMASSTLEHKNITHAPVAIQAQ